MVAYDKNRILLVLASGSNLERIAQLIKDGADVNTRDKNGITLNSQFFRYHII
jgi:ankyrin repeat protein